MARIQASSSPGRYAIGIDINIQVICLGIWDKHWKRDVYVKVFQGTFSSYFIINDPCIDDVQVKKMESNLHILFSQFSFSHEQVACLIYHWLVDFHDFLFLEIILFTFPAGLESLKFDVFITRLFSTYAQI